MNRRQLLASIASIAVATATQCFGFKEPKVALKAIPEPKGINEWFTYEAEKLRREISKKRTFVQFLEMGTLPEGIGFNFEKVSHEYNKI